MEQPVREEKKRRCAIVHRYGRDTEKERGWARWNEIKSVQAAFMHMILDKVNGYRKDCEYMDSAGEMQNSRSEPHHDVIVGSMTFGVVVKIIIMV